MHILSFDNWGFKRKHGIEPTWHAYISTPSFPLLVFIIQNNGAEI